MRTLESIPDIKPGELELLEAVGYSRTKDLGSLVPAELKRELDQANRMLSLLPEPPALETVEHWIRVCRDPGVVPEVGFGYDEPEAGTHAVNEVSSEPAESETEQSVEPIHDAEVTKVGDESDERIVDFESDPEVVEMLLKAPLAIPLDPHILAEQGISPSDIAVAPVLSEVRGDLDVRVTAAGEEKAPLGLRREMRRKRGGSNVSRRGRQTDAKRGVDDTRVRHLDDERENPTPVEPQEQIVDERLRRLRTAKESTNRGRNPESRWFIRGVLHDRPVLVGFGALFAVLVGLLMPLAVVASLLLVLSRSLEYSFSWVSGWWLAFPIALMAAGIGYMLVSLRVKCRVCGQKVLAPKHCLKHRNAHHVPGLGHIIPLAAHVLSFRWFRCTFCGTSIRTKE